MADQKNKKKKVAFILGAGFSKCAEVPIQAEFSPLLTSEEFDAPVDLSITSIIKDFLISSFGWKEGREIPSLEDVFTFIDLSVSKGHYFGRSYTPPMLRALRRLLIYRIFQILDKQFKICPEIIELLRHYQEDESSFIVLNWDIVLEKHLLELEPETKVNYISPAFDWNRDDEFNPADGIQICKMHGSSNWVYCENCKALYYQVDKKLSLHRKVGLSKTDLLLFDIDEQLKNHSVLESPAITNEGCCKRCQNILSSHIATFSYRKSFRTAAYSAIWHEAENLLAQADHWIFIGYSLPEADFEFKHLIKSAELRTRREHSRKIDSVLYQDEHAKEKFERFFGRENVTVFENGLQEYVEQLGKKVKVRTAPADRLDYRRS